MPNQTENSNGTATLDRDRLDSDVGSAADDRTPSVHARGRAPRLLTTRRAIVALAAVVVVAVVVAVSSGDSSTSVTAPGLAPTQELAEKPAPPAPPSVTVPLRVLKGANGASGSLTVSMVEGKLRVAARLHVPHDRAGLVLYRNRRQVLLLAGFYPGRVQQQVTLETRQLLRYRWIEVQRVIPARRSGKRRIGTTTVPVLRASTGHLLSRLITKGK